MPVAGTAAVFNVDLLSPCPLSLCACSFDEVTLLDPVRFPGGCKVQSAPTGAGCSVKARGRITRLKHVCKLPRWRTGSGFRGDPLTL